MRILFTSTCILLSWMQTVQSQTAFDTLDQNLANMPSDTGTVRTWISIAHKVEDNNPQKALQLSYKALDLAKRLEFSKGVEQSLNSIGRGFKSKGEFDSSLYYFRKSLAYGIALSDKHFESSALMNIGTVFRNEGIYDSATVYYHHALSMAEQTNDLETQSSCLNNLGNVLKDQGNLEDAIHYYEQALDSRKRQKNNVGIANAYLNLGVSYDQLKQFTTSKKYFKDALDLYTGIGDKAGIAKCDNNIAQSLISQNMFASAIPYLNEALKLKTEIDDKNGVANSLYSLALLNKSLKNYNESIRLSNESLAQAISIGNKQLQLNNYSFLQSIYFLLGNFKQAYTCQEKAANLKDSLFNVNKARIIDELQTKYETEKKSHEIKTLSQENEAKALQRNIFLIGSIGLLSALLLSFFIFLQQRRLSQQKLLIQDRKITDLLQEQTIKTYNAMMAGQEEERKRIAVDLHDRLGSMLATVRMYFSTFKEQFANNTTESMDLHDKTLRLFDLSIDELRTISNNLSSGLITDLGLRPAIEELCETVSHGSDIKCEALFYNLNERIDNQTEIGIYRIVQELLSNILKHARAKSVTVQFYKVDNDLQVTIEDDGVGYDFDEKMKSPGMGLKNILARIGKLNGKFHVESSPGNGSFSFLEVPLRRSELDYS